MESQVFPRSGEEQGSGYRKKCRLQGGFYEYTRRICSLCGSSYLMISNDREDRKTMIASILKTVGRERQMLILYFAEHDLGHCPTSSHDYC